MVRRLAVGLAVLLATGALLGGAALAPDGAARAPDGGARAPRAPAAPALPALPGLPGLPGTQPDSFYDAAEFLKGLQQVSALAAPTSRLVGGVVPHHILAGANLSTFFVELEHHPPKTVIVVGPNHPNRGQRVITGRYGWATAFGTVTPALDLIDRLAAAGVATVDDHVLTGEHSVGALMPYLSHHASGAQVVPLILHHDLTISQLDSLAGVIAPLLGPDLMLIASVDFSHYLTRIEAEAKDDLTLAAILRHDLTAIRQMNNDHLDSPASLILLMMVMQRVGAEGPEVAAHTNSGVIIGNDLIETTSYFTLKYREGRSAKLER